MSILNIARVVAAFVFLSTVAGYGQVLYCVQDNTVPANPIALRAEGMTELVSDVVLSCTTTGQTFAGTLTASLDNPNVTAVSSKVINAGTHATEATLRVIDKTGNHPEVDYQGSVFQRTINFSAVFPAYDFALRISNVRVNVEGFYPHAPVYESISAASQGLALFQSPLIQVGVVANGLAVGGGSGIQVVGTGSSTVYKAQPPAGLVPPATAPLAHRDCDGNTGPSFALTIGEVFGGAFKTKSPPLVNGLAIIPGGESGSYVPGGGSPIGVPGSGTRLKVVFANIPANAKIRVPVTLSQTSGATTILAMHLTVGGETGAFTLAASAAATPGFADLSSSGGIATAIYEVTTADIQQTKAVTLNVAEVFAANTVAAPAQPVTVAVSFAPSPISNGYPGPATLPTVPYFANTSSVFTGSSILACPATPPAAATKPVTTMLTSLPGKGNSQTFMVRATEPAGYSDIKTINLLFDDPVAGKQCYLNVFPLSGSYSLVGNTNLSGAYATLGSGGFQTNSECQIQNSQFTLVNNGNSRTITASVVFKTPGLKNVFASASSTAAGNEALALKGYWLVPDNACAYSLNGSPARIAATKGETGTISITTTEACSWIIESDSTWLTSGASLQTGSASITYTAAPNYTAIQRVGTITAGDQTVSVSQPGTACVYSVTPATVFFTNAAVTTQANLSAADGCPWTASSDSDWLSLTSVSSGTGSLAVELSLSANDTGTPRTGILALAGQSMTVTQRATAQTFSDVTPDIFYFDSANSLRERSITAGCSAAPLNYCGEANITRAQMAIFIVRSIMGGDTFTYAPEPWFTDVAPADFGFKWIQKMKELGITSGCAADRYCPDLTVSRDQMAVFIARARYGSSAVFAYSSTPYFDDVPDTNQYFKSIQKMKELSLTSGCTATNFCPQLPVTRGQMAIFIMRGAFNKFLAPGIPSAVVFPSAIAPGQKITIEIIGANTHFAPDSVILNVPGLTIDSLTAINDTILIVNIAADPAAVPGPRSVTIRTGTEEATAPNGLLVTP